jgi:Domain of unknown function (DUF4863)
MDKREKLIARSIPFLEEIKDLTPGTEVEQLLNKTYGPGSDVYDELASLITAGIREGWAANVELNGPRYRRSRMLEPCVETHYFSITAVYMNSMEGTDNAEEVFRGDYHLHPYGELNLVVPLDTTARLAGFNGWCGRGWTAPAPGSHHYPEAKGGALIALFFLPAGRISYDIKPPRA